MQSIPEKPATEKPDSVWNHKPWWCQPWSILLTGIAIISSSWLLFKLIWLSILVAIPILIWMGFFLILFPRLALQEQQ
ncbi:hypothetical protein Syn7502_03582 [Synechococcus sp. PCC 7502]|uniref:DUF6737 family protein n=1 Tax=Synechococcus sp. PCC 7502 TaxID=1173263 RepID=UPI00029FFDAA|nr:DUF6737 family protein [Synechococcus sp. PCC 7502]AFY75419.1 hypothetical protein Syn7502_03582 [Synechococcus sp. PCC 7502]